MTFVTLLNELLPSGIRGLVLAALLAALISSLLAVMNSISTMVVRDFIVGLGRSPRRTVTGFKRAGSSSPGHNCLGIGAAWLVGKTKEGLYKYLLRRCRCYLITPIFPPILFGIMSKRVTLRGRRPRSWPALRWPRSTARTWQCR